MLSAWAVSLLSVFLFRSQFVGIMTISLLHQVDTFLLTVLEKLNLQLLKNQMEGCTSVMEQILIFRPPEPRNWPMLLCMVGNIFFKKCSHVHVVNIYVLLSFRKSIRSVGVRAMLWNTNYSKSVFTMFWSSSKLYECFYNWIDTRCFQFLEIRKHCAKRKEGHSLTYFDHRNANSLCFVSIELQTETHFILATDFHIHFFEI